jgi:hypothetical protein
LIVDEEEYLEHYGKKGMRWGERRSQKRISKRELKTFVKKNKASNKAAAKTDPTFRREVKLTRKGKGISITKLGEPQVTPIGGLHTSRILGKFKNSRGEKVSEDFANAVLSKAVDKEDARRQMKQGVAIAGAILAGRVIGKTLARR